jgi:ankyrin repeat protein
MEGFDYLVETHFDTRIPDAELRVRVNEVNTERDLHYATILNEAIMWQRADFVKTLLRDFGADPNLCPGERTLPLDLAICHAKDGDIVHLLLQYGADVNIHYDEQDDGEGHLTPFDVPYQRNFVYYALLLLEYGADYKRYLPDALAQTWDDPRRKIHRRIRLLHARRQRALQACCAIRTLSRAPRDVKFLLMHLVWNTRRNEEWDMVER